MKEKKIYTKKEIEKLPEKYLLSLKAKLVIIISLSWLEHLCFL